MRTARDVLADYAERINRHDFDLLVDLIASDATFWFSDGSHRGIEAIRAAFEATWRVMGSDEHYWLDQHEWMAEGDNAAACTYRFNWKTVLDGQPVSGSGRGTAVLGRVDDHWWIVHEHLSGNPG
jgi:ketosteroid isomerase-like protein